MVQIERADNRFEGIGENHVARAASIFASPFESKM